MKKLIEYSARHPISILMYFALAIILAGASLFFLNAGLLPQTKDRWILVSADYEGVRAEEIRKLLAIPLEENLASLKGIKNCESTSRDGLCSIKIELKWGADAKTALLETNAIIDSAMESLPEDCPRPVAKIVGDSAGKIVVCVIPKDKDLLAASDFARDELKPKLLALEESSAVEIFGGQKRQVKVVVDSKMAAFYGLSLESVADSMNAANYDYPAGSLREGQNETLFKTEGSFKSFGEILETPLKANRGQLKLGDIARAENAAQNEGAFCFYNTDRCVLATVFCKRGRNPLKLSRKAKALLNEMRADRNKFELAIVQDSSDEIKGAAANLFWSAILGTLISFALTALFFRSAKIAAAAALSIPLCVLFSFLALAAFGKSANLISMAGVTVSLGMVIDNSIVAMESVLCGAKGAKDKKDFAGAVIESLQRIALSNAASTITTVAAFLPLFFIGGIIGELFGDLGIAIVFGILFSLLHSFTALPALCVLFLKAEVRRTAPMDFGRWKKRYARLLKLARPIKGLCPISAIFFLAATLLILLPIKKELQPKGRERNFLAAVTFEPGSGQNFLEGQAKALAQNISGIKGVKKILLAGGLQKDKLESFCSPEEEDEKIRVSVWSQSPKKTRRECEKAFKEMKLNYEFLERPDLISERLSIKSKNLFFAENPRDLFLECQKLFEKDFVPRYIKKTKVFKSDKSAMEKTGLSPLELSKALKISFDGCDCFPYYENGKEIHMKVQFEENELAAKKNLEKLKIFAPGGQAALSSLGRWENQSGEGILYRFNGRDAKIVPKEIKGRTLSLKKRNLDELLRSAALLLFVALALLYCVLGAQTESFRKPLIFFLAVPPAFFGAALFLLVFGSSLNINSIIAFAALFGVSVNNSIILCEGGAKKFSSVLVTSATSIASLLPFAIDPFKANPQSSLALAIAGGLLVSTAASLILIPNVAEEKIEGL